MTLRHPMEFDAFGLPVEQQAIHTGTPPAESTARSIPTIIRQLKMLGFSCDWSREIATTEPACVRWTQWIFLVLHDTWFDREQERGGHSVVRIPLWQWMLRITAYGAGAIMSVSAHDDPTSSSPGPSASRS